MMIVTILNKQFDLDKITIGKKEFDLTLYNNYRDYLLSLSESDVIKINIVHAYARIRFIGQKEQPAFLKEKGYIPPKDREELESRKGFDKKTGPSRVYKSWVND